MSAFLQDTKIGFLLDRRMRGSISRTQTLPRQSSFIESVQRRGRLIFVFGSISHDRERSLDLSRKQKQLPIYYISQAFQGTEAKYPRIEKMEFALIVASRKLRPYFQANPILIMTDQPIKKSMNKPDAVGRMVQWVIELSQFDIEYHPMTAIKAQALPNFIVEFTLPDKDNLINEMEC